ncbi:MAG TPA: PHP domain-containing protein [Feifaniaceae bacterium]|nr:PHP domain-containing protein [Feifaniaceae bacterium]
MSLRMDLHCHSSFSDGTAAPHEIVRMAAKANIGILSLTDHDTISGVADAVSAGKEHGVLVLPGIEMDNESPFELHILGLDIDPMNEPLREALAESRRRRNNRNVKILGKLKEIGCDVRERVEEVSGEGTQTRMHIAVALRDAGYAATVTDAFRQFLNAGAPAYYVERRYTPKEVIALLRNANGIPVLAHPCYIRQDPHRLIAELKELGLMGVEAYYPASTLGQTAAFESLAEQHGLLVTCGSDYHGKNREGTPLGCAWRDVPCLRRTAEFFQERHSERVNY